RISNFEFRIFLMRVTPQHLGLDVIDDLLLELVHDARGVDEFLPALRTERVEISKFEIRISNLRKLPVTGYAARDAHESTSSTSAPPATQYSSRGFLLNYTCFASFLRKMTFSLLFFS